MFKEKKVSLLCYLGRHAVLLGNKLFGNLSDGVDGKGEPVVLFGVCMQTNL